MAGLLLPVASRKDKYSVGDESSRFRRLCCCASCASKPAGLQMFSLVASELGKFRVPKIPAAAVTAETGVSLPFFAWPSALRFSRQVSSCDTCRGVYSVLLVCIWFCHRGVLQSNFLLYSLAILRLRLSGKAFFLLLLRFLESMTAALLEMLATQIIVKNRYAWCSAKRSKLTDRISWSPDSSGRRLLWEKCSFVLRKCPDVLSNHSCIC